MGELAGRGRLKVHLGIAVLLCALFAFTALAGAAQFEPIPVTVRNPSGAPTVSAPVSAGIPFPRGALSGVEGLSLSGVPGMAVPVQVRCLSRWPDGSCRWVLLDFQADVPGGAKADFRLTAAGKSPAPANAAVVKETASAVTLSNGLVEFRVETGAACGILKSADGKAAVEIASLVEIGGKDKRITSKIVIDRLDVYERGPVRAAVSIYGRRIYSDGIEGPFSQTVEMFAGSPYVRVEDTFVYAHFPGTHAKPQNPLGLWKVEAKPRGDAAGLDVISLAYDEEAEGLVTTGTSVAFWGKDEPFDLSRWTDEELVGEDTPGIALGVGKSCALAIGLLGEGADGVKTPKPGRDIWAHTTPAVYAASGALGDFAPRVAGEFEDVERGIDRLMNFWMWFQDNDPAGLFGRGPWHGLFDWGDWQCSYRSRRSGEPGWTYLEGRYGWDCNEMDTTLMLWSWFFHTADPDCRRAAVAMSRHTMDVDMINVDYRKYDLPEYVYDPHVYYEGATWSEGRDRLKTINIIGMGRRHNVQHWGNGVGDTRHTWNGGVMMYYYMTGSHRAYDAVIQMADMHMQRLFGCAAGEYALSLWCFYNASQLTGQKKYLDELKYRLDLVHRFRKPDGTLAGHIDFQKGTDYPNVEKGQGGSYLDLTLDYITCALIDYYADTGDKMAREVLMGLAERVMKDNPDNPGSYSYIDTLRVLSWAYMETRDKRFIERVNFHLASLAAPVLEKEPADPDEWLAAVKDILTPFGWSIRHVGPGMRMAPYAMKAITASQKDNAKPHPATE